MMKQFQDQKIDNLEANLMRGMFQRKLKDFAEFQHEQQDDVPMIERLKIKKFKDESEDEIKAKDEFRKLLYKDQIEAKNER